jgi:hypothetical protein
MSQSASNSMANQQEDDAAVDFDVDVERQAEDDTDILRDDGIQNGTRKERIFGRSKRFRSNGVRSIRSH